MANLPFVWWGSYFFATAEMEVSHSKTVGYIVLSHYLNQYVHVVLEQKGKALTETELSQMDYTHSAIKRVNKIEDKYMNQKKTS